MPIREMGNCISVLDKGMLSGFIVPEFNKLPAPDRMAKVINGLPPMPTKGENAPPSIDKSLFDKLLLATDATSKLCATFDSFK